MITAAVLIPLAHLLWVVFVIFGALGTRGRTFWSTFHILASISAIFTLNNVYPCPLTLAENYFIGRTGQPTYQGRFLVHYLNHYVSPNLPAWLIVGVGVSMCCFNLGIYARRFRRYRLRLRTPLPAVTGSPE
ncbi:MAG: DUF2784 family protein [Terracidiphilus sp.]|jgi:hypothetical protein